MIYIFYIYTHTHTHQNQILVLAAAAGGRWHLLLLLLLLLLSSRFGDAREKKQKIIESIIKSTARPSVRGGIIFDKQT